MGKNRFHGGHPPLHEFPAFTVGLLLPIAAFKYDGLVQKG
jgi:hypothetical protein